MKAKVYVASTSSIKPPVREVLIIADGKKAAKWNWEQHLLNIKDSHWAQGWVREATDDDVTRILGDTIQARLLPTQSLPKQGGEEGPTTGTETTTTRTRNDESQQSQCFFPQP